MIFERSLKNGSLYLPVTLPATIGQPEKQHRSSANRKRELGWTAARGVSVNNAYHKNRHINKGSLSELFGPAYQ